MKAAGNGPSDMSSMTVHVIITGAPNEVLSPFSSATKVVVCDPNAGVKDEDDDTESPSSVVDVSVSTARAM